MTAQHPQAFYHADYARFARALGQARHGKPEGAQPVIDQAAETLAGLFESEDMTARPQDQRFDRDLFLSGTQAAPPASGSRSLPNTWGWRGIGN